MFDKCEQLSCVSLLGGSFKKKYGSCQNLSPCHADSRDGEYHETDPPPACVLKLSPCAECPILQLTMDTYHEFKEN